MTPTRPKPGILIHAAEHLRAEFGLGTVTEIGELFRTLAVACVKNQVNRVLIVAGDDDPAHERSLRDALTTMVLAGIPSDFRLGLVAAAARVAQIYRNVERDATAVGISTRLFVSEEDATAWLSGPAGVPRDERRPSSR